MQEQQISAFYFTGLAFQAHELLSIQKQTGIT